MDKISERLSESCDRLRSLFEDDMDFILREFKIGCYDAALAAIDGLNSKQDIALHILGPIMTTRILQPSGRAAMHYVEYNVLSSAEQLRTYSMDELTTKLLNGFSVLLIDGCEYALCFGTQGGKRRGIAEPEKEVMQRGSREGFVEAYQVNAALIRSRMRTADLKIERMFIGSESHTPVLLCYLKNEVDRDILSEVKGKLSDCTLKNVLAAGYLAEYLEHFEIFESIGMTERPDTLCGKLQEGRIGVIVDGTPTAIIVPYLFIENFQAMDDYAARPFFAAFSRFLRYTAFLISIFLPGIYVGIAAHDPELLPDILLVKIAAAVGQTPFPIMFEVILLYFMYEMLREAGMRVPKPLSSSVSIVGGLVIGETAVTAGLVSAPSLVVIALTVITGFVIPKLYETVSVLRLVFIVVGGIWGVWGVMLSMTLVLFNLCGTQSLGVPFMSPIAPFDARSMRDVFVRLGWKKLSRRTANIRTMPGVERKREK